MSEKKKNKTICHFDEDDENFLLVIIQQYYPLNKISTTVISFVEGKKKQRGYTQGTFSFWFKQRERLIYYIQIKYFIC